MTVKSYVVEGMTCGHCVNAVTQAVQALPGVAGVDVDLASGRVAVSIDAPVDDDAVRVALDEAGYTLRA